MRIKINAWSPPLPRKLFCCVWNKQYSSPPPPNIQQYNIICFLFPQINYFVYQTSFCITENLIESILPTKKSQIFFWIILLMLFILLLMSHPISTTTYCDLIIVQIFIIGQCRQRECLSVLCTSTMQYIMGVCARMILPCPYSQ